MLPTFSIIVPCYRIARCRNIAEQCIASIAQQSIDDYELLLVDDGSGDGTDVILGEILMAHAALLERSRVLVLPQNEGVCAARNAGIDAARGKYVSFLDFDDLWQHRFLAVMKATIAGNPESRVFLARTDFMRTMDGEIRVGSGGSVDHLNAMDGPTFAAWHLLHNFPVAMGSAVVVERRLYEEQPDLKFDLALSRTTAEDVLFGFQLLSRGIRPFYVDEPLCMHRRLVGNLSRGYAANLWVDERQVNDYIAQRATAELTRNLVAQRPELECSLRAQRNRLDLEFDLKRLHLAGRYWSAMRRCVPDLRGLRILVRLIVVRRLINSPLRRLLWRYYFLQGGNDSGARQRVIRILAAVGAVPDG